jgi:hypothetical protein
MMEIFLHEIPEEGLSHAGELSAEVFQLSEDDPIRPAGPVRYDARLYRFDDLIVLEGSLSAPFQLQCGICLDYCDYLADFPEWRSDLELDEGQASFDLAAAIREDFLLNLPASPRCEDFGIALPCPRAELLRQVQNAAAGFDPTAEAPRPDVWKALDDLS